MIMIDKKKLQDFKDKNMGLEQFVVPTKKMAIEFKTLSDKIDKELKEMELENKAFFDSYEEIVGFHKKGMSMEDITNSYEQEKIRKEHEHEKNDVLEMFKNKLQSLKAALSVNGEF